MSFALHVYFLFGELVGLLGITELVIRYSTKSFIRRVASVAPACKPISEFSVGTEMSILYCYL